ncbi:MAG: hypothetical protein ACKO0V_05555, partial [bacterium]
MLKPISFIASLFAARSAARAMHRVEQNRRGKQFLRSALLDLLEERQLLATFSYNSGTGLLSIVTNNNNEAFTILSTSDNGNYTITSSFNFSGSNTTGLTGAGTG